MLCSVRRLSTSKLFTDMHLIVKAPNGFIAKLIQILWRSLASDGNLPVIEACKKVGHFHS